MDRSEKGKQILATAKLSEKFQISIPKTVREAQGWRAGQRLAFVPHGAGFLLVPAPTRDELFGAARGVEVGEIRERNDRA